MKENTYTVGIGTSTGQVIQPVGGVIIGFLLLLGFLVTYLIKN